MPSSNDIPQWQKLVNKKQAQLSSRIPNEYTLPRSVLASSQSGTNITGIVAGAVSIAERQITELPLHKLLDALCHGHLTCQEVLAAFFHRAVIAHQLVHCLSEIDYEAAQLRAQELDQHWRQHHSPIGPLHGLPVSLTDRFHLEGLDSACGFVSWTGCPKRKDDEGGLVKSLRKLGAVIFCKTAVPTTMMMGETASNLLGTTYNPYNVQLSAGGACGGEGALIACHGSPLGFGTDIAGSSRIPSSWNHLWSLKCSEDRLAGSGVATALSGLPLATGAIGLMSKDLQGISVVFQALLQANGTLDDSTVVALPWRSDAYNNIALRRQHFNVPNGKLCFGVMDSDGHVLPHPTISRAIQHVTAALTACGHEVIEFKPSGHAKAVENLFQIFGSTCMAEARVALDASGEPPISQIKEWYANSDVETSQTTDFWALCKQRAEYRAAYASYIGTLGNITKSGRPLDGIILPVAPTTAVRPGNFFYYGYSAIANVLDYTAGTFPVMTGDQSLDQQILSSLSPEDQRVQKTFSKSDIHGMPIGLQVMCPRLQEERTLAIMQAISEALNQ